MRQRQEKYRTGDEGVDRAIGDLLSDLGVTTNRDQIFEIMVTAVLLANDRAARLDLKITNAALKEMREAFVAFAPYRHVPKVTMFGSARTMPADPLYVQARALAAELAGRGWMVVTGAGPGIMAAGLEGAGRDHSFGVNIRLPFEQAANEFIDGDDKLVNMKYFFTRKVMLLKESAGFVSLPGGFGTQDETFELLTLLQTGKSAPAPLVLLDIPDGTYWRAWTKYVDDEMAGGGWVSPSDESLYLVTDTVPAACDELLGFYRNYHSIRYVGDRMIVRLRDTPTTAELATLNAEFSDLCLTGEILVAEATSDEQREKDALDMARLSLTFDRARLGRFRVLINVLNSLGSAPSRSDSAWPPLLSDD